MAWSWSSSTPTSAARPRAFEDPGLRSLDAIHLATALSAAATAAATFFAYDERLIAAARAHGLTVTVPRP